MEIMELKQRIVNFVKINQTLTNAMTNQQEGQSGKGRKMMEGSEMEEARSECPSAGVGSEGEGRRERGSEQVRRLTKLIEETDFQIKHLNKIGGELRAKIEERNAVVGTLEETVYNLKCRIEKKEEELLRAYKQVQELEDKLDENDHYIQEVRRKPSLPLRNCLNLQELEEPAEGPKRYAAKNSSYLLMRATPDQSGYELEHNNSCNVHLMQRTLTRSRQASRSAAAMRRTSCCARYARRCFRLAVSRSMPNTVGIRRRPTLGTCWRGRGRLRRSSRKFGSKNKRKIAKAGATRMRGTLMGRRRPG
jgi:hypothetical protein